MSFEEFIEYYKKYKKTPGMLRVPNHTLNEKELKSRYEKYSRPKKKKVQKGSYDDPLWLEVVSKLHKRDRNICRLLSILTEDERNFMYVSYPKFLLLTLDPAHVIPRSKNKSLYYELDNLVLLNRVSHSFLDSYKHPVYGTPITREERRAWWEKIVGKELLERLA